ncbi:MAG TPA: oxidoreductase [Mycobacteriales bacterium]|nr:oxidoreductase [Mycobacteriales bacterium]
MASSDPLLPLLDLPGVGDAAEAARDAVDRLLRHRVLRRGGEAVSAESALRGARASAALDGVDLPLDTVRSGSSDPVVQGALRVGAAVGRLVGTWERAPAQALARLHVLAAAGREPGDALGRPSVDDPGAAGRLAALARQVAAGTSAPAAVLAAVVHGELLAPSPFRTGGGLVARAAVRLTVSARGLDRRGVSVPEVGHVELGAEYQAALADYATGRPDGVARWVRHCCAAIELGAGEGLAICEALARG